MRAATEADPGPRGIAQATPGDTGLAAKHLGHRLRPETRDSTASRRSVGYEMQRRGQAQCPLP
eukprot:2021193-Alexandrium_andersonii.AAC.1